MKRFVGPVVGALSLVLMSGCAGTTPVTALVLPPASIIEGQITQTDESGFTLADNSGSIYVRAILPGNTQLNLSLHETVRVYGNLLGGQEKIFDGYVIKKSTGEQMVISAPTPHFGCIVQGAIQ